jgi:hypothetical protein
MSTYANAEDLIVGDLDLEGEDVTLPSGKVVRVRGLSRYELMLNGKGTDDSMAIERRNVRTCLVEPKLSDAQVATWQKQSSAGGDFRVLSERIRDLSGLGEGAQKSDVDGDGDRGA